MSRCGSVSTRGWMGWAEGLTEERTEQRTEQVSNRWMNGCIKKEEGNRWLGESKQGYGDMDGLK